jgi:hypothetical protein
MEALRSFKTSGTTDAMTSFHISPVLSSQQLFSISFPVIILLVIFMFPFLSFFLSFFLFQPVALSDGGHPADCCCQVCDVVQFGSATFEQYTIILTYCSTQRFPISERAPTFARFPGFARLSFCWEQRVDARWIRSNGGMILTGENWSTLIPRLTKIIRSGITFVSRNLH